MAFSLSQPESKVSVKNSTQNPSTEPVTSALFVSFSWFLRQTHVTQAGLKLSCVTKADL